MTRLVCTCASDPKPGEQRGRRGLPPPPARQTLGALPTAATHPLPPRPGRARLPALISKVCKRSFAGALFGEKADGGSSSCSFEFWEPARAFQSEKKPLPSAGAQMQPQGWVLTPAQGGLCQRPCTKPNIISLFKRNGEREKERRRKKRCSRALACTCPGNLGRASG